MFFQSGYYICRKSIFMKKLIPVFIALLFCFGAVHAFAQDCDFQKDEMDAFTKQRYRSSELMKLSLAPFWWMLMEQKSDKYFITMQIFVLKEMREQVKKGTKVMAKLEDGTIVELTAMDDVSPSFNFESGYIVSQWTVKSEVSDEQMMQLSKSPIELMRTKIGSQDLDMPKAVKKGIKKVMNMAGCMLQKS